MTNPINLPGWEYENDPTAYGFYNPGDNHIHVCDAVAEFGNEDPLR